MKKYRKPIIFLSSHSFHIIYLYPYPIMGSLSALKVQVELVCISYMETDSSRYSLFRCLPVVQSEVTLPFRFFFYSCRVRDNENNSLISWHCCENWMKWWKDLEQRLCIVIFCKLIVINSIIIILVFQETNSVSIWKFKLKIGWMYKGHWWLQINVITSELNTIFAMTKAQTKFWDICNNNQMAQHKKADTV